MKGNYLQSAGLKVCGIQPFRDFSLEKKRKEGATGSGTDFHSRTRTVFDR
jgi:hypothetical protein